MSARNSDVAFIGHLVNDFIIIDFEKKISRLGGIANCADSFADLDKKNEFTSKSIPLIYGDAIISIDTKSSEKFVHAEINRGGKSKFYKRYKKLLKNFRWTHVSYINKLDDFEYPKEGIVSVDLCAGPTILHMGQERCPDYIFVSTDEHSAQTISLQYGEKAKIISHNPYGCELFLNGEVKKRIYGQKNENLIVLGAGDHFASAFIYAKLKKKTDEKALEFADTKTRKWLLSQ